MMSRFVVALFVITLCLVAGCQEHRGSVPDIIVSSVEVVGDSGSSGMPNGILNPNESAVLEFTIKNIGDTTLTGFDIDAQIFARDVAIEFGMCGLLCADTSTVECETGTISCHCETPGQDPGGCESYALAPGEERRALLMPMQVGGDATGSIELEVTVRDLAGSFWLSSYELEVQE